ncbi:MAG: ParA family protein [Patulibacter minatonensis]
MAIYALANQKGGVGKTTTAVSLAASLAEAGAKSIVIDADPQANATVALGLPKDEQPSLYDVLAGEVSATDALRDTDIPNLRVLPGHADLAAANVELPRLENSDHLLRDALAELRSEAQFIFLDCPPSIGPLTLNALGAADRVIVPVQAEYFALEGLGSLLETLALVQKQLNPELAIEGLVITMWDPRTRLSHDVEAEVRKHFPSLVFDTVIPRNVRLSEAPSYGLPITQYDARSTGAEAYVQLAEELAARA